MNPAEITAHRLSQAAEIAAAWAAGEFRQVTAKEAWDIGFDSISATPQIFTTKDGTAAIYNPESGEIDLNDMGLDAWAINPETGELRRG